MRLRVCRKDKEVPPTRSSLRRHERAYMKEPFNTSWKGPGLTPEMLASSAWAAAMVSFPVAGIPYSDTGHLNTVSAVCLWICGFPRECSGLPRGHTYWTWWVQWTWEELGEVDEYDQNTLYDTLKQPEKSKRGRQVMGKGVYSGSLLKGTGE